MGGPGSGNRWRSSAATCEQYLRIDLAYLRKQRWLQPNTRHSLSWSIGGEPAGNITYWAYPTYLQLVYRSRNHGESEWQDVQQFVHMEETPLHFGGERQWFLCPRCKRRCRILYGGARFYCRKCYRLCYRSQLEDNIDRTFTRSQKVRRRLGGPEGIDDPFPEKPKGMHWKTYKRLVAIDEQAQNLWVVYTMDFIAKWDKR